MDTAILTNFPIIHLSAKILPFSNLNLQMPILLYSLNFECVNSAIQPHSAPKKENWFIFTIHGVSLEK